MKAYAQLAQPAQKVDDGPLGSTAHLFTLGLRADAATQLHPMQRAWLYVNGDIRHLSRLRRQLDANRRKDAEVVEATLGGGKIVRIVGTALFPRHAVEQLPRGDGSIAVQGSLAEAHLRPWFAGVGDPGLVLVALDLGDGFDLSVGKAVFLQALVEAGLYCLVIVVAEECSRHDIADLCNPPGVRLELRRKRLEDHRCDAGRGALFDLQHDVHALVAARLHLVARDPRVEKSAIAVERNDTLQVQVEGRLVEPLLRGERPPARLDGRQALFDVTRGDLFVALDSEIMNPNPRGELVVRAAGSAQHQRSAGEITERSCVSRGGPARSIPPFSAHDNPA